MITSADIEPGGWTPIPHSTARDPRIDRRALGLLVEVLSYPPGWTLTMDALGETGREGRDANRAAFGKLVVAGYIIEHRYREHGRWRTATFAGATPVQAQRLADEWLNEHPDLVVTEKPRSRPKTEKPASVEPASENPVSYRKNERKTEEEDGATAQARDQSRPPSNPPAIAEVAAIAEAPAGAGASTNGKSVGQVEKETHRGDTRQRDDSWRLQLQAADLDDLYDALAAYHKERQGLEEWAYRTAASDLGIDFDAGEEVPEQADGDWTRLTYLYLLKKHDSDPGDREIHSALLEPLDSSIQAPERSYRKVEKLPPPAGVSPREFADQMKAAVTLMEPTEIGPYIAEFREVRRGVWWESLGKAEELLRERKQKVTAQAKNYVALHVAIDRYVDRGTWEMELVPPSMRLQGWQSPGEAPPWAA